MPLTSDAEAAAADLQRFLIVELATRIEVDAQLIDPRQPFERYGVDSLNALRLSSELEARIGCRLPATLVWDYPTIESLARYLAYELNVREIRPAAAPAAQA
jgi:acyl carrier protein